MLVAVSLISHPQAHAQVPCSFRLEVQPTTWDDPRAGMHYIVWRIVLQASGSHVNDIYEWITSSTCRDGSLANFPKNGAGDTIIDPATSMAWFINGVRNTAPATISWGIPTGGVNGSPGSYAGYPFLCGFAPTKPATYPLVPNWARPPVARWSDCRQAAGVDDGGSTSINGQLMYCQGLPSPNCGNWPGANAYPNNGGAGNLLARWNCNSFDDDNPGAPFNPNSPDFWFNCNDPAVFSWYNRQGMYDFNNIGRSDLLPLINTDANRHLRPFRINMTAFNTQPGDFSTAINLTLGYRLVDTLPHGCGPGTLNDTCPPPTAYPWLQVHNGDVAALGQIFGQRTNNGGNTAPGARPIIANDKEAQYVIIASMDANVFSRPKPRSLQNAPANPPGNQGINYFCSTSSNGPGNGNARSRGSYEFGNRGNNTDGLDSNGVNACASGPYVLNLSNDTLNPVQFNDNIIYNTLQIYNDSNFAAPVCSQSNPYNIYPVGSMPSVTSGSSDFNPLTPPHGDCSALYLSGQSPIGNFNVNRGRATIFMPFTGRLDITGNITNNNFAGCAAGCTSVNQVPNLGIIVNGDVYIHNNVTRLDASIYAKGVIYTCDAYGSNSGNDCRNPLVVHGSLIAAGGFRFGRTYTDGSSTPAENIITNGQFLLYPPPGFENRFSQAVNTPFFTNEALPNVR